MDPQRTQMDADSKADEKNSSGWDLGRSGESADLSFAVIDDSKSPL
jgi:hypothetical protein